MGKQDANPIQPSGASSCSSRSGDTVMQLAGSDGQSEASSRPSTAGDASESELCLQNISSRCYWYGLCMVYSPGRQLQQLLAACTVPLHLTESKVLLGPSLTAQR